MRFTKMHGIGNDYIFVNCFEEMVQDPSRQALLMSRPHFGVGADGLVLIEPSETADFGMRIFNADGSEAEMCGNASRCIGKYVYERGMTDKTELTLATKGGIRQLKLSLAGEKVSRVQVDMGSPELNPRHITVDLPGEIVLRHRLSLLGQSWHITCVNMGNPHCVIFVNDPETIDLNTLGPLFENHPLFPRRTNVEFVRVIRRDVLQMRVWERGSGLTLACGTGASASAAAAVAIGCCRYDTDIEVRADGGILTVRVMPDGRTLLGGEALFVFDGETL